jgi:hypothetical protein
VYPRPGASSEGLRLLRATAEPGALRLVVEGVPGREYTVHLRTTKDVGQADGAVVTRVEPGRSTLRLRFQGAEGAYVRRSLLLPLS